MVISNLMNIHNHFREGDPYVKHAGAGLRFYVHFNIEYVNTSIDGHIFYCIIKPFRVHVQKIITFE